MKKFLKWVFIILFVIPACVGILSGISGNDLSDNKTHNADIMNPQYSESELQALKAKLGDRINNLGNIEYGYALRLSQEGICQIDKVDLDLNKSRKDNFYFIFSCTNGKHVDADEEMIRRSLRLLRTREDRAQASLELEKKIEDQKKNKHKYENLDGNNDIYQHDGMRKAKYERIAREEVRKNLKDPNSAQFRNQHGFCGEVNAKNSFGGYTGFKRFVVSFNFVVIDDGDPEVKQAIDRAWNNKQICGY